MRVSNPHKHVKEGNTRPKGGTTAKYKRVLSSFALYLSLSLRLLAAPFLSCCRKFSYFSFQIFQKVQITTPLSRLRSDLGTFLATSSHHDLISVGSNPLACPNKRTPLIVKLPLAPRSSSPRCAKIPVVPNLEGLLPMSLLLLEDSEKERHDDEENIDGWLKRFVCIYLYLRWKECVDCQDAHPALA